uniref:Helicase ATP-binding domain-containing protein n=1 Tax=viral metagenome TaxID=1070528 RepID=A0A6C0IJ43_9ZZZZ
MTSQTKFEEWLDLTGLKHEKHQKDAVKWCLQREQAARNKGGIIADEMGLGKTIEILGTVYSNPLPNTLIVLPYSLLGQWESIITTLFHTKPLVYHGGQRKRLTSDQIIQFPIVLTTYGLVSKKLLSRDVINPLYTIQWDRVIYDEAHHLRNKNTKVFTGGKKLQSAITWLLTGTPIQNSVGDLYNLYNLLGFTSSAFIKTNIEQLINEYMLRRTIKVAGITLPPCHATTVEVSWKFPKEKTLAEDIHVPLTFSNVGILQKMLGGEDDIEEAEANEIGANNGGGSETFKHLAKARKVCVLPLLVRKTMHESSKIDSVVSTVLARKNNGKPKIIFCYYHAEIDEIATLLQGKGMRVLKFDGRTGKKERGEILVDTCDALIGQIDAMNEGLNLQAYKEVYIVSPHWNPAIEDQAVARCHRIGQTEEVQVFRFIMTGFEGYEQLIDAPPALTLDQYICRVQEFKRDVVKKMLIEPEKKESEKKPVKKTKKRVLVYEN